MQSKTYIKVSSAFMAILLATPLFAQQWSWQLNRDFLNPSGINPPRNNSPFLYDIDSDGDLDLILGQGDGTIALYYNDGFPDNIRWRLDEDYFDALSFDYSVKPALGDFDGDDSLELVLGFTNFIDPVDSLRVFKNRGTLQDPIWEEISGFFNISTDRYAYFKFIDWDNDGDYDFIAVDNDNVEPSPYHFFRNQGIPGRPVWLPDTSISNYLPAEYNPCGNEGFEVCDLNSDGSLDFIFSSFMCDNGSMVGWIRNAGPNENPRFNDDYVWLDIYLGGGINSAAGDTIPMEISIYSSRVLILR